MPNPQGCYIAGRRRPILPPRHLRHRSARPGEQHPTRRQPRQPRIQGHILPVRRIPRSSQHHRPHGACDQHRRTEQPRPALASRVQLHHRCREQQRHQGEAKIQQRPSPQALRRQQRQQRGHGDNPQRRRRQARPPQPPHQPAEQNRAPEQCPIRRRRAAQPTPREDRELPVEHPRHRWRPNPGEAGATPARRRATHEGQQHHRRKQTRAMPPVPTPRRSQAPKPQPRHNPGKQRRRDQVAGKHHRNPQSRQHQPHPHAAAQPQRERAHQHPEAKEVADQAIKQRTIAK